MKRALNPALALAISLLALVGCGGGADTVENPTTSGPDAAPDYAGPPPATADIQAFRINFWENVRGANRCGVCHAAGDQAPQFARSDDVNAAYQQASGVVDRDNPSQSAIVLKVAGGHNCWLADAGARASIMTRWIQDWVGSSGTGGRRIELAAPPLRDPGSSRRFPSDPLSANFGALYALLDAHCSNCHQSNAATAQSPYFAADDIDEAYIAAIPRINLDEPERSRFYIRLAAESHNCWSDCRSDAEALRLAIEQMADSIPPTQIDPALAVSKAVTLYDGTIASGGARYENHLIALYEFKTGSGGVAYDTSGVDPAADLMLSGDVGWVGGWGLNVRNGKAQASTTASRKLHQLISATGEYSIEAWVAPGAVTQEDARIVSYSGSATARNFTMGQTLYSYDFYARSSATDANGAPQLSTADADRRLQATLQHVVMTFDPVNGRRIYVNGEFTGDLDAQGGGVLGDWDNSFALVLGAEVNNNHQWTGVIRLVAIHDRALTLEQVQQNFAAGVGEKFFLLFGVGHLIDVAQSYIMFEASQYDSHGYLFNNPKFISLDANARPDNIVLKGMRIGLNGAEPSVGQAYRLLDLVLDESYYTPEAGQELSRVGTIIPLEQGPASDEFFLCFDQLGARQNVCSEYAAPAPATYTDLPASSDIGVRTFDEINAAMAAVTGVSPNNAQVKATYESVRQSLPAVHSIEAFVSSHQTSIAQLAIQYCSALVDDTNARASYFPGMNWTSTLPAGSADRDAIVDPLIERVFGDVASQPESSAVRNELDSLITSLCNTAACGGSRTVDVVKAVCGAAVGSAALLVK